MIEPTNWWKTKIVMFVAKHTPKCHDITRLVSESMDRPLPLRTRIAMRIHYLICQWCDRYRKQLGFLREALKSCPEPEENAAKGSLPAPAKDRLKVKLRAGE